METCKTYVYFALTGEDFDPQKITDRIGINPTESWKKGDNGKYNFDMKYSCWKLSTLTGKEEIEIDNLVSEIINKLNCKIDIINELKIQFNLASRLEIVLDIDINPIKSTPALGHDLRTIEFLFLTKTKTDIDIYRYDSTV